MLIKRQNWGFYCGRDWRDRYTCMLAWGDRRKTDPDYELGESPFYHTITFWPLFNFLWYRWRSPWGKWYDFPIRIRRW